MKKHYTLRDAEIYNEGRRDRRYVGKVFSAPGEAYPTKFIDGQRWVTPPIRQWTVVSEGHLTATDVLGNTYDIILKGKTPIGLRPKIEAQKARLAEIREAKARYLAAGMTVPGAWFTEEFDLISAIGINMAFPPPDVAVHKVEVPPHIAAFPPVSYTLENFPGLRRRRKVRKFVVRLATTSSAKFVKEKIRRLLNEQFPNSEVRVKRKSETTGVVQSITRDIHYTATDDEVRTAITEALSPKTISCEEHERRIEAVHETYRRLLGARGVATSPAAAVAFHAAKIRDELVRKITGQ